MKNVIAEAKTEIKSLRKIMSQIEYQRKLWLKMTIRKVLSIVRKLRQVRGELS